MLMITRNTVHAFTCSISELFQSCQLPSLADSTPPQSIALCSWHVSHHAAIITGPPPHLKKVMYGPGTSIAVVIL